MSPQRPSLLVAAVVLTWSAASAAPTGITGTFFPAVDGVNSFQASDGVSLFSSTTSTTGLWHDRVGVFDIAGLPSPLSGAYQGQALTSNEVVTTITGLLPGVEYNLDIIHGVHTGPVGGLQDIDVGFTSGALTRYLEANSILTGDLLMAGGFWHVAEQSIGTAFADGNGEIVVYVDYAAGAERTIYNGLAYTAIGSGTPYCFGDGLGTTCPCGNNNNGSQGGCDWGEAAFPEGGVLSANGSASMAANNTFLIATGVADDFGVFYGANNMVNGGNGNPLNDGLRCAGGGLIRLIPPTMASGNMMTLPAPVQTLDTGAAAGVTRRYQYWFRTPAGPCGQQANLTNGYEIVWIP